MIPTCRWIQCPCEVWLGKELLQAAENDFFWVPGHLQWMARTFISAFTRPIYTEKRPVLDCLPYQLYSRQICLKSPFWAVCETNPKRGKRCLMAGLVYTNNFVETYNSKDVCNLIFIFHHLYFFLGFNSTFPMFVAWCFTDRPLNALANLPIIGGLHGDWPAG